MVNERETKRALLSWGVGRPFVTTDGVDGASVAMLEDINHLTEVLRSKVLSHNGNLFVPDIGETPPKVNGINIIPYQGDPTQPATELSIGADVFVQNQDYSTAEYMSVIGPTLLRMFTSEDFDVFLADLDAAEENGCFPEHLIHPAAQVSDRSALGDSTTLDGPKTRLHLRADGSWSVGPLGLTLGSLGDNFTYLQQAWRESSAGTASVALGNVIMEKKRANEISSRPWLGYALSVVTALQDLAARGIFNMSVSGFGGRFDDRLNKCARLNESEYPPPDAVTPVLLWNSENTYLHIPQSGRTFWIDREVASAFEAVIVTGSPSDASYFAPHDTVDAVWAKLAETRERKEVMT